MESQFKVRAKNYLGEDSDIVKKLGEGQEGTVWETTRRSALKVFERGLNFNRELRSYQILQEFGVSEIDGFNVPQLLGSDNVLLVIEMTVVTALYILDFGKAYFEPPDYPSDAVEHDQRRCEEDFGKFWPTILAALYELQTMGIWYVDANRRNINCDGLSIE